MDDCTEHHAQFAPKVHPDAKKDTGKHLHEHKRGAGHPAHHTPGLMPSQLQPDHGPHK